MVRSLTHLVAAAAVFLIPQHVYGHGLPPIPLALWGPFASATADCLRQLSDATHRCFHTVLTAHRRCVEAELGGNVCDIGARDDVIAAARTKAAATVETACRGGQLTELRFANATDAVDDVLRGCGEAETTTRMIYAPALNPVVSQTLSVSDRRCVANLGQDAGKLLLATLTAQSRVFNAIAVHIMAPSEKLGRLSTVNQILGNARTRMAAHLGSVCAGVTAYKRTPAELLTQLGRRSGCVLSATYFHISVSCPTPECGDGIVDGAEACDDANGIDADGCRSDCSQPMPSAR